MGILELIAAQNNRSARGRLGMLQGNKSLKDSKEYCLLRTRSEFIAEARSLEEEEKLIRVDWYDGKSVIQDIHYNTADLPEIYRRLGLVPPWVKLNGHLAAVNRLSERCRKPWIRDYCTYLTDQLAKGNTPPALNRAKFLDCLEAVDQLTEPVYKRVFSIRFSKDSKTFEEKLQEPLLAAARKFCPDIDDNMNDSEALSQLLIEDYAQELYVKGELRITLEGREVNLKEFPFGVSLNSRTLDRAGILDQTFSKIITIENKANFETMQYTDDTLFIFSHGYFSPREVRFLNMLYEQLKGKGVEYYHSGDLDFGGIRIFQFIRKNIFPELRPLRMEKELLLQYKKDGYGRAVTEASLKTLKNMREPLLQELIDTILEEKWGIEQECYL